MVVCRCGDIGWIVLGEIRCVLLPVLVLARSIRPCCVLCFHGACNTSLTIPWDASDDGVNGVAVASPVLWIVEMCDEAGTALVGTDGADSVLVFWLGWVLRQGFLLLLVLHEDNLAGMVCKPDGVRRITCQEDSDHREVGGS